MKEGVNMSVNPTLGLDNFQNGKVLSETESMKRDILRLIFMRPGALPSLPHLGLALQDYLYQFYDAIDTTAIKNAIASQCLEYLPYVQTGSLDVRKLIYRDRPTLLIILPAVIEDTASSLVVAVSTDALGDITYNTSYNN